MFAKGYRAMILIPFSVMGLIALASAPSLATVGSWTEPALDRWFHQGQTTPGLKTDPSTFATFDPGAGFSQARSGTLMLGFDTSDLIPLVSPSRYQINSVTVTATMVDDGRQIPYDPTPDLLSAIAGGTDDTGKPIELYGVGFDNGYTQLGFGTNDAQPPEFEESSPMWDTSLPVLQQTFNVFPLGDDGTGTLGNVFNSPGGEGIFELDALGDPVLVSVTKPAWDSVPWAVGTVSGLNPGDLVPGDSVFSFNVNLTLPGVLDTFQQSLALGQLDVFLSSLHDLSGFHTGGLAEDFPAFYSKESLGVQFGIVSAATLDIDFTLLPATGDYDKDEDVDGADFLKWQQELGTTVSVPGSDPDGDVSGIVDAADLAIWKANYGTGTLGGFSSSVSVPEPTTGALAIIFFTLGTFTRTRTDLLLSEGI